MATNTEAAAVEGTFAVHCGYVRWAVKTGTDRSASQVNLHPQKITIAALLALKSPLHPPPGNKIPPSVGRQKGTEFRTYTVSGTLMEFAGQHDSDIHLVISDSSKHTMIVEIPNPACVSGGPFKTQIANARKAFLAKYPNPPVYPKPFAQTHQPVTVTGVGFFDYVHGQSGVAKNGVELHPVLDIVFN